jgi:hypothetical protein
LGRVGKDEKQKSHPAARVASFKDFAVTEQEARVSIKFIAPTIHGLSDSARKIFFTESISTLRQHYLLAKSEQHQRLSAFNALSREKN